MALVVPAGYGHAVESGKHGSGVSGLIGADQEVLTLGDGAENAGVRNKDGERYPALLPVVDSLRCVTSGEAKESGNRSRPAHFLDVFGGG